MNCVLICHDLLPSILAAIDDNDDTTGRYTTILVCLFVQESGVRFPVAAYLVLEQGLYLQLFQIPISRWRGLLSLNR